MRRNIFIIYLVLYCCQTVQAQKPSKNYILEKQMLDATGNQAITTVIYYDGLGYPEETATNGLGGNGKYTFTQTEYDVPGRAVKEWIPGATSSNGNYLFPSDFASSACSSFRDSYPFYTTEYDPLGRIVAKMGPGSNWNNANKGIVKKYDTNTDSSVKKYVVSSSGSLEQSGFYASGTLSMEMTSDEDGKAIQIFSNIVGGKILERRDENNDTYYIYDDLGLLRFVLSPSYQEEASLEKFAYEYRYDESGRCIWKRLPGCEYQQLWYDNADNLMFSQDGEMRKKGIYMFYLYDNLMRQVIQGTTTAINRSCTSAIAPYQGTDAGLFNSGYVPTDDLGLKNAQLYLASYYDDHNFLNGQLANKSTSLDLATTSSDTKESYNKGALTGTISRTTDGKFLVSAIYHNQEGLVVETKQAMPDEALLSQRTTYSFTRKPLTIETQVKKGEIDKTITQKNRYNQYNDKIESIILNAGNDDKEVALYRYDDIGRLVSVKRSGNAGTIANEYNIRNWLTSTTSGRFRESLKYENGSETPCYNGNISRMQWLNSYDNVLRGYDFEYDGLNRLTTSSYAEGTDMSQNKDKYSENIPQYSPNGSIERLQRYGKKNNGTFGLIDDLTYQYNGNQIQSISDKAGSLLYDGSFDFKDGANESTEYFYNANGALTKDLNKGISQIEYDMQDNLSCITFNNGFKTKYVYDASGNKLRTVHEALTTNTTDYIGDFIFEDGKLSKYQFEGGYCSFDNNLNPTYHYYEKDHLGSVRMVVNENGIIEQVNHYYPFGGAYGDLSYNSELQRNKYIGKEFDHTSGLDWYDHGARMYDAAKGCWDRMDHFCEKYYPNSPYISCFNIPTRYIDESGDSAIVLLAPYGAHNFGHLAIAIQNENGIWCLYSKNGTYEHAGIWGQEGSSDTEKHNDRGEKKANDINSLFNDPSINPKADIKGEREDVPNNAPEYTEGYLLYTNSAQDKKMVEGVLEVIDKDYNLANSNCAQAVQNALKKAGLNPGRGLIPKKGVYPSIIKNNPKGKVVLFYNTHTKKHYKYAK